MHAVCIICSARLQFSPAHLQSSRHTVPVQPFICLSSLAAGGSVNVDHFGRQQRNVQKYFSWFQSALRVEAANRNKTCSSAIPLYTHDSFITISRLESECKTLQAAVPVLLFVLQWFHWDSTQVFCNWWCKWPTLDEHYKALVVQGRQIKKVSPSF